MRPSTIGTIAATLLIVMVFLFFGASVHIRPWRASLLDGVSGVFAAVKMLSIRTHDFVSGSAADKIAAREHERIQLLGEIANRDELKRENELLRQALALGDTSVGRISPATVIGFLLEGRDEFLLLNTGAADGFSPGDIVLSRDQVFVGSIVGVSDHTAHVLLITSPSRSTDVSLAGSSLRAIAKGNNERELAIELVPQQADLRVGDLLVASPRSTGLSKPVLVARVIEVEQAENQIFKIVRAAHLFDPADDEVIVLAAPR